MSQRAPLRAEARRAWLWSAAPRAGQPRLWLPGEAAAAWALAGYTLLTLALTYPLIRQFSTAIPGDGFDGWQNYWNLWWVKTALLNQHTHPFFTNLLYAPTGVSLLFHTLNPFNGLLTLPVQLAWGLTPAYNTAVVFSYAAAGLGAYLLARQVVGRSRPAAFIAGLIFTFAPVHIAHLLGHLQVMSVEWLPFYALYLWRLASLPSPLGKGAGGVRFPHRNILLAALFLILTALCDWYFVMYCAALTAVVLAWRGWAAAADHGPWRSRWVAWGRVVARVAAAWAVFAVALSPLLAPMVSEALRFRFMAPDPAQSRLLSADLLAFVIPQEFHPLWGRWAQELTTGFTSGASEHTVFVGYTALALAAVGAWTRLRSRTQGPWLLALAVFWLLALGPVLHIGGQIALLPGGREIPLPYGWLAAHVPFMDITRSVSRFDLMVMLVIAVLAAFGVRWLLERRTAAHPAAGGRRAALMAAALGLLVIGEFLPAPYPMSAPDTPAWYAALAADPRPGALLNVPMNWDRPGYLLYQTVHQKPLTVAYISRDDPRTLTERAPVLQHFRRLGPDIITFDLAAQGEQVLADLGVRWVALDRYQMPGARERGYNEDTARAIFGGRAPVYEDERLTVYEVTAAPGAAAPYLVLGEGWGPFDSAKRARAFTDRATIVLHAPAPGRAQLRVTLAPGSAPLDFPPAGATLAVQPGANSVVLRARQPGAQVIVAALSAAAAP